MKVVLASGLEIAYERVGVGPSLVFMSTAPPEMFRMWQPQLDALADEFTVVAWDKRVRVAPRMCPRTSA